MTTDNEVIVDGLIQLLNETDTPELREICSEDEWVRAQRNIYHRIRRSLDCDVPLRDLMVNAIEDVATTQGTATMYETNHDLH